MTKITKQKNGLKSITELSGQVMIKSIEGGVDEDSDHRTMLTRVSKTLKIHSYFFPTVQITLTMPAFAAYRLAKDFETMADEYKPDSS